MTFNKWMYLLAMLTANFACGMMLVNNINDHILIMSDKSIIQLFVISTVLFLFSSEAKRDVHNTR